MNIIKICPASMLASPRHARLNQNTEPWQNMVMTVPLTDYKVRIAPYLASLSHLDCFCQYTLNIAIDQD